MGTLIDRFLNWVPCFGEHTIMGPNGQPYLKRKYLLPKRMRGSWWPGVFLHKFYQSDNDRNPHNHPWRFAVSLILTGGYTEQRYYSPLRQAIDSRWRDNTYEGVWRRFLRRPLSFNVIRSNDFHKAELLDPKNGAWTLFVAWGHKKAEPGMEWGFMDTENKRAGLPAPRFVGWKEYLPAGADGLEHD
jgi:hypothetical protein